MIFELKEIKEAHSKVKSGSDFPNYVQDLIKLGVRKYDTYVSDGHTLFSEMKIIKFKQNLSIPNKPSPPGSQHAALLLSPHWFKQILAIKTYNGLTTPNSINLFP